MRVGVIAKKMGMTAIFDKNSNRVPVTILKIDSCQVIEQKTKVKHGYTALKVGAFDEKNRMRVAKPSRDYLAAHKIAPKKKMAEFRVADNAMLDVGTEIRASHYVPNQFVDVTSTTIGKGFAGVMKRHNFAGLRASHGVSISHRSHGSTGQRQDPGKVFKGKKMAGHMGDTRVTVQNLQVISIDEEKNLLIVKGAVPGAKNSYCFIKDAVKRALPGSAPYPALVVESEKVQAEISEEAVSVVAPVVEEQNEQQAPGVGSQDNGDSSSEENNNS